ncbi:MAG: 3-deoxy-7-phosphoheptulonate synthase AroG [Gammaproteobacteria bacterium]|nr:3-deoxy-7-phosphoheptulonate synthase AroG [Gammaproteobacteria bacterium]
MTKLYSTDDLRIKDMMEVIPPVELHQSLPITDRASETTSSARHSIHQILHRQDDRLLTIIGPCSIHDPKAAREYATRLMEMARPYRDQLVVIMRVYFEKPRTTVGWKGLINDPDLDESFDINKGLNIGRSLLLDLNNMGVPVATEYLDLITPQYFSDLVAWGAIGARTTESQVHRELASGLSCPVGFKNATDGSIKVAVDAISASQRSHHFLSVTKSGHSAIFATTGNDDCHIILRGGKQPNYQTHDIAEAVEVMESNGLNANIMVDCSHANSQKQYQKQLEVGQSMAQQISAGNDKIIGVMVESHLVAGRQDLQAGKILTYGQSITDACIGLDDSEEMLELLADAVEKRRIHQNSQ